MQEETQLRVKAAREFGQLESRARDLLAKHRTRNPHDEAIAKLLQQYKRAVRRSPEFFVDGSSRMAQLYLACGEPIASLEVIGRLAQRPDDKAKKDALTEALRVFATILSAQKKFIKKYPKSEDEKNRFIRLARRILKASTPGGEADRLAIYIAIFRGQHRLALDLATKNASNGPQAVSDLMMVIKRVFSTRKVDVLASKIGNAVGAAGPAIKANGHQAALELAKLRYAERPEQLTKLGLGAFTASSPEEFLRTATDAEIGTFLGDKDLWLRADAGYEQTRLAVLREVRKRGEKGSPRSSGLMWDYLKRSAQTVMFWKDEAFRRDCLEYLNRELRDQGDYRANLTKGLVSFLLCDKQKAFDFIHRSINGAPSSFMAGPTSFFINLDDKIKMPADEVLFSPGRATDTAVVSTADGVFFARYGRSYVESLRRTGSQTRVHFHVADPTAGTHDLLSELQAQFGNVSFSVEQAPVKMPGYYACMRFVRSPLFLEKVAPRIYLTDIDVKYKFSPDAGLQRGLSKSYDVELRMYDQVRRMNASASGLSILRFPRVHPWAQINAAFLGVAPTRGGRKAMDKIAEVTWKHIVEVHRKGPAWLIDQNALFYAHAHLMDMGTKIANIEDLGVPFGFDYSNVEPLGGFNPVFNRGAMALK